MMWGAACALGGAAMGVTLVSATEEGTENEDGYYFREFDPNCPYLALDPDRWWIGRDARSEGRRGSSASSRSAAVGDGADCPRRDRAGCGRRSVVGALSQHQIITHYPLPPIA